MNDTLRSVTHRAEALVTAVVRRDRDLAAELVEHESMPEVMCLVLADMAAAIHRWRCEDLDIDPEAAWARFLVNLRQEGL